MNATNPPNQDEVLRRMLNTPSESHKPEDIEMRPDGEARFRAAVHAAAKSGPKHRPSKAAMR